MKVCESANKIFLLVLLVLPICLFSETKRAASKTRGGLAARRESSSRTVRVANSGANPQTLNCSKEYEALIAELNKYVNTENFRRSEPGAMAKVKELEGSIARKQQELMACINRQAKIIVPEGFQNSCAAAVSA